MTSPELMELIFHTREERNLEYKASMNWTAPETKANLAKSVMAMSNIPDGGAVVIGVEELGGFFQEEGMDDGDFRSFSQDDVMAHVNEFADPYVEVTVSPVELTDGSDKRFVVIQVREFEQLPVVCKKEGMERLRRGALFTRSRRKYETAEVGSQSEMREILDLAVDKEIRRLRQRGILLSGLEVSIEDRDRAAFEEQLGGL